ncbi:hypothetical protein Bbelb_432050 [Branchiostoma belcheri]|nr:hypothetical protein Bbelb_432050 [Branchiostoma belcheri]
MTSLMSSTTVRGIELCQVFCLIAPVCVPASSGIYTHGNSADEQELDGTEVLGRQMRLEAPVRKSFYRSSMISDKYFAVICMWAILFEACSVATVLTDVQMES